MDAQDERVENRSRTAQSIMGKYLKLIFESCCFSPNMKYHKSHGIVNTMRK